MIKKRCNITYATTYMKENYSTIIEKKIVEYNYFTDDIDNITWKDSNNNIIAIYRKIEHILYIKEDYAC